jgi:nucleoside-diphosphate-sugar epimerase
VALTGASGYTGGRLLAALRDRGDDVAVLVRPRSLSERLRARASSVVEGDLADAAAVDRLVAGRDAVLHVAAVYRTAGHPDAYYREVNVLGTERLLEAAARHGVRRFVHTSTVGVHGHVEHPPADETAPFAPGDVYQATKAEAEQLALDYHRRRVDFWTKSRAFTIEKARRLLGYDPKTDLDRGVAVTAAWYREAGWL